MNLTPTAVAEEHCCPPERPPPGAYHGHLHRSPLERFVFFSEATVARGQKGFGEKNWNASTIPG